MRISRREFVESGAVSVAGWYLLAPSRLSRGDTCVAAEGHCALLDLGVDCGLRESLRGYQEVLEKNPISVREMRNWRQCSLVVVPGMVRMDTTLAGMLLDLLEAGTNVLLESGAGFSSAGEFGVHRGMLRDGFEIEVEPAVNVWGQAGNAGRQFPSYVEYVWPCLAMVRDFSRVIPVRAGVGAEVIASAGLLPVAAKKRAGKGMLVFLGSPLGPALLAGDLEARGWLRLLATTLV